MLLESKQITPALQMLHSEPKGILLFIKAHQLPVGSFLSLELLWVQSPIYSSAIIMFILNNSYFPPFINSTLNLPLGSKLPIL